MLLFNRGFEPITNEIIPCNRSQSFWKVYYEWVIVNINAELIFKTRYNNINLKLERTENLKVN